MTEKQYEELQQRITDIEKAIKAIKPAKFSWWPFWTGGWMFTMFLYGEEALRIIECLPKWQAFFTGPITWIFWPAFLGTWVNEFAQHLIG